MSLLTSDFDWVHSLNGAEIPDDFPFGSMGFNEFPPFTDMLQSSYFDNPVAESTEVQSGYPTLEDGIMNLTHQDEPSSCSLTLSPSLPIPASSVDTSDTSCYSTFCDPNCVSIDPCPQSHCENNSGSVDSTRPDCQMTPSLTTPTALNAPCTPNEPLSMYPYKSSNYPTVSTPSDPMRSAPSISNHIRSVSQCNFVSKAISNKPTADRTHFCHSFRQNEMNALSRLKKPYITIIDPKDSKERSKVIIHYARENEHPNYIITPVMVRTICEETNRCSYECIPEKVWFSFICNRYDESTSKSCIFLARLLVSVPLA